jgi:diguanylate cyclase (GGDEF)-like protein/PAS domain S-box-containing protein
MTVSMIVCVIEQWKPEANLPWVANGLLLAYLLLAPRRRWPAYLIAGFLALSVRILLVPKLWNTYLVFNLLDMIEVATGALLLRRRSTELPRFTEPAYLMRFVGYAILAGPIVSGTVLVLINRIWQVTSPQHPFLIWMGSDTLGIAMSTPAFVAIFQSRLRNSVDWRRLWFYPVLLLGVAFAAFAQNTVPLVYLIYPLLVLILIHLGLGYASLCTLLFAAISGWLTIRGLGPFAIAGHNFSALPSLPLQAAVASAMLMIYTVSVVLERQKATEHKLQEIVSLHHLVSDNSRDLIIVADFDGNRSYVSSAVQSMFGWKPEEAAAHTALQLVHPEDLYKAEAAMRELQSGSEDALVECRVRKANGEYLWVEAALRLIRDPSTGLPSGILNIVRDISERKRSEQRLREAYRAVEAMSLTDVLTGLANRRRFDQYLATEWRRSMRDSKPLSLLMCDVDQFKAYNDTYGHQHGDSCLKQIAEACMDVVSRPGDLVARFGGEEFVVVLPNTESEGALQVANKICESLRSRRLPHTGSPFGIITISIGCATLIPQAGMHAPDLIAMADHALYTAKHNGRNQVCLSSALERREEQQVS